MRSKQLDDESLRKVITALEGDDSIEFVRWSERGYIMSNGILYHFDPESDDDDPQLVIPANSREEVMKQYHDSSTAGHYGVDRTLKKISSKFYFMGMRRYVTEYIRNCVECQRYKATNLKPAGLLQTPAPAQRFEVIAVDLFGPLPETPRLKRWILIIEDIATKWVELFALEKATSEACAMLLIEEIFLRYGTPRKMISDNGVQFISDIMQKVTYCFDIRTPFIPLYHAESNPVERKNRELKTQLAILVKDKHDTWDEHISSIRFAMNSTTCDTTGHTPAYLTFGRELRSPHDTVYDLRKVVEAENFVPRITPYLKKLSDVLCDAKETLMKKQDARKDKYDQGRRQEDFKVGDRVLLKTHTLSNQQKGFTAKLAPKRDGPYWIKEIVGPNSYIIANNSQGSEIIGKYHVSDLSPFHAAEEADETTPRLPKRKRGRPRKNPQNSGPTSEDLTVVQRGRV
ncbi:hypothetical protein NQ315_007043 [Exocentrus adspersus]|uniref:RNA-directed DNA polymerase n=1 Tax=Exocentrus adspersus TaxID=1586481 RepID=A0AAV8VFU4_9CUCU|nr:hypothetical protein NQ315_006596 [Exocentrus adspersus]KAJ8913754.1 hypothetical protein NQ315_002434 [Exocentrus adspersus]KAJ8924251.1 hypothetical protein NQ315_007043 [Exocentrus adspersus]